MSFDAACLVKQSEALTDLGLSATNSRLDRLALAISQRIEEFLGFSLGRVTFTVEEPESLQGAGGPWLQLGAATIESIEQILLDGSEITDYVRSAKGDARAKLYREWGWPRACPREVLSGTPDDIRRYNVTAAYTGGFWLPNAEGSQPEGSLLLPATIQQAAMDELIMAYKNVDRSRVLMEETTPGGWKRKHANATGSSPGGSGLSADTCRALGKLKRRWFGHA